ncbi:MAG: hypothetical protein R8P61_19125 [Bacteroidia bacterium]|nr:hypothetical protein [Bacteroidia bacterium]
MKSQSTFLASIFSLSVLFTGGCEEEILPEDFTHVYYQTNCSDPWGDESDDRRLARDVKNYLKDEDIEIEAIKVYSYLVGFIRCANPCDCPSGLMIKVLTDEGNGQKILGLEENWYEL